MERLIQEFTAVDGKGDRYRLLVYEEQVLCPTRENPQRVIPGMKRIVTADDESVNWVNQGEYEVVGTGTVLRSDDPGAP
jgi:hypothetical protein